MQQRTKPTMIFIHTGRDRGKYARILKMHPNGNAKVQLEKGVKILVEREMYFVIGGSEHGKNIGSRV